MAPPLVPRSPALRHGRCRHPPGCTPRRDRVAARAAELAVAWKHPAQRSLATVRDVTFRIGRTGNITPMLTLAPTRLDDRVIRRVSLGSLDQWQQWDVRPGDDVTIRLAGATIPQLDDVMHRQIPRVPIEAPDPGRYHDLSCLRLVPGCEAQFLARLTWISSREGLDMPGIGEGTWSRLIAAGLVEDLHDCLTLSPAELEEVPGVGERRADQWHARFQAAQRQPFTRWLAALGMPSIPQAGLDLADSPSSLSAYRARTLEDWQRYPGIGEVTARRLVEFFSNPILSELLDGYVAPLQQTPRAS